MTPARVMPSRADDLARRSSLIVGGPAGRRAVPGGGFWVPVRVLLVVAFLVCATGLVSKDFCRESAWGQQGRTFVHLCYSDVPFAYRDLGLAKAHTPWADYAGTEPVLTDAVMHVSGLVATGTTPDDARRFYDLTVVVLMAAAAVVVVATTATVRHRPWDAAPVAFAAPLGLTAAINWDLLAVALVSLALLAWSRRHPVTAGVLLGMAAATKPYAALLLVPLLLVSARAGRLRQAGSAALAAVAAWVAINVPVLVSDPSAVGHYVSGFTGRGPGLGTFWFLLDRYGPRVSSSWLWLGSSALYVVVVGVLAALVLGAPRRPRLAQVLFLAVAGYVLVATTWSPQHVLWLLPLAAMARPVWRDLLIWQGCEVAYFVLVWLHLDGALQPALLQGQAARPDPLYSLAVVAHLAAVGYLVLRVVLDVLSPATDPVRADGSDDPGGGVLDGALGRFAVDRPDPAVP